MPRLDGRDEQYAGNWTTPEGDSLTVSENGKNITLNKKGDVSMHFGCPFVFGSYDVAWTSALTGRIITMVFTGPSDNENTDELEVHLSVLDTAVPPVAIWPKCNWACDSRNEWATAIFNRVNTG